MGCETDLLRRITSNPSTYPLRLPTSLKAAVAEISKADGTSINQIRGDGGGGREGLGDADCRVLHRARGSGRCRGGAPAVATRRWQPPEPEDQLE